MTATSTIVPAGPAESRNAAPPEEGPPVRSRRSALRRYGPLVVAGLALTLVVRAGARWWHERAARLPAGIVYGNGRLEADEIDIDTKFPARVAALYVNEGDLVHAGQVVARMDVRDLEAERRTAQATALEAARALDEAQANVAQEAAQVTLAKLELDRYQALVQQDFVTHEDVDQRRATYDAAVAALAAGRARIGEAQHALDAAQHVVEFDDVNIRDNTLAAPRDGRILYRIANLGEMLPSGGKVFTMLDATSVYMDIYLPTLEAGRIRLGGDARIVLDAYPRQPIPATVSFLATEAEFTPKAVETKSDRDNLMFRVKIRIDSTRLLDAEAAVRTGLPGVGYVRVDSATAWPPQLGAGELGTQSP